MTTLATPPSVAIYRCGPFLRIKNPPPKLICLLAVQRVTPALNKGANVRKVKSALFAVRRNVFGTIEAIVWAGLESVVVGLFKSAGMKFSIVDELAAPMLPMPMINRAITDPLIIDFIANRSRGLVRYADGIDVLWLIVQVCLAFRNARIVVIVRRRKEAKALETLLVRHGIQPVVTNGGAVVEQPRRVTVTLLGQMSFSGIAKADLVLVADALFAIDKDPLTAQPLADPNGPEGRRFPQAVGQLERLSDAEKAKTFGFLCEKCHRSPKDTARCWQAFGSDELAVLRSGVVEAAITVAFLPTRINVSFTDKVSAGAVLNMVRMDPARNRRLAGVAAALQAGDIDRLEYYFCSGQLGHWAGIPQHVLVVVESDKQARAVAKILRGWPVITGLGDDPNFIKDDAIVATRGVIATALAVPKLSGTEFDVIVRADPGEGLPQLPPGWRNSTATLPRNLLLVDAWDGGHAQVARLSRKRKRTYRAAGFAFLGEDTEVTAWKRFQTLVLQRRERP